MNQCFEKEGIGKALKCVEAPCECVFCSASARGSLRVA